MMPWSTKRLRRNLTGSTDGYERDERDEQDEKVIGEAALADEYGTMDASGTKMRVPSLALESGLMLLDVEIVYRTYGTLSAAAAAPPARALLAEAH